jgi:hypothetical protein
MITYAIVIQIHGNRHAHCETYSDIAICSVNNVFGRSAGEAGSSVPSSSVSELRSKSDSLTDGNPVSRDADAVIPRWQRVE